MIFHEVQLMGAYIIEPERLKDERGFFARSFCQEEFKAHGLNPRVAQCDISFNRNKGTLRGMHYQVPPRAEVKVVRCTRGAIFEVIIDLRPGSPTYCKWLGVELTMQDYRMLYVPEGFAHGYQTLAPDTEVIYLVSEFYAPECQRGVRWNDPAFGIKWPLADVILSAKDRSHPDFHP